MKRSRLYFGSVACALFAAVACGPELDDISQLETLRIIGLRKSQPYARPGEQVKLEMLWEDASASAPRRVERFIGFWCVNPPGDLFSACLTQVPTIVPQFVFNDERMTITLPKDIVHENADPKQRPYGVAYVFYGVCAGHLVVAGRTPADGGAGGVFSGGGGVPMFDGQSAGGANPDVSIVPSCVDERGQALGSKDFVIGYSAVYAYDSLRNQNPRITGFKVAGKDVAPNCIDDACVGKPFTVSDPGKCPSDLPCVAACKEDGDPSCPAIAFQPIIDPKSAEDDTAAQSEGSDLQESLWVSYFTDRGRVKDSLRLVNDASTGWNEAYGTALLAPAEKGPLRIWAAVRDNRGGISWVRTAVYVQ